MKVLFLFLILTVTSCHTHRLIKGDSDSLGFAQVGTYESSEVKIHFDAAQCLKFIEEYSGDYYREYVGQIKPKLASKDSLLVEDFGEVEHIAHSYVSHALDHGQAWVLNKGTGENEGKVRIVKGTDSGGQVVRKHLFGSDGAEFFRIVTRTSSF